MRLQRELYTWIFNLVFVGSIFNVFFAENTPVYQSLQIELCLAEDLQTPSVSYAMFEALEPSEFLYFDILWSFSFNTYIAHANSLIAISFTSAVRDYKPLAGFCFNRLQKTLPFEPSEAIAAIG